MKSEAQAPFNDHHDLNEIKVVAAIWLPCHAQARSGRWFGFPSGKSTLEAITPVHIGN
jgi:hypothetical protein